MTYRIINADVLDGIASLPDESVQCVVTSPPYFALRNYGCEGQIGLEPTLDAYIAKMVEVFREVRRVLRKDGTCWLNLGDSYCGGGDNSGNTQEISEKQGSNRGNLYKKKPVPNGLKPKDLMMVPARVALAPALRLRCRLMAGGSVLISFGRNRIRCLSRVRTGRLQVTSISSC